MARRAVGIWNWRFAFNALHLSAAILVIVLLAWIGLHRVAVVRGARRAYEESRVNPSWRPGSYEFLTYGLTAGQTEEEVNRLQPQPTNLLAHMHQESPQWDGFVSIYEFKRGPTFAVQFLESGRKESTEVLYIYFDQEGKAVKMTVSHYGAAAREADQAEIDLRASPSK